MRPVMINRRTLMVSAAAGACLVGTNRAWAQTPSAASADAALTDLMNTMFNDQLDLEPEMVTTYGLDSGERVRAKSQLNDRSRAGIEAYQARFRAASSALASIDRERLSHGQKAYFDTLAFHTEATQAGFGFGYGGGASPYPDPYVVSQMLGAYTRVPDFLDSQHTITSVGDAEAYVERLTQFAVVLGQESDRMTEEAGQGVMPPDFCLDGAIGQLETLLSTAPTDMVLVRSIARRAPEAWPGSNWEHQAEQVVSERVIPALKRQRDTLAALRSRASSDAGVWKLPRGDDFYAAALRHQTTTDLSPDDVHAMGLEQVAELSARADGVLKAQGLTHGTVAARIAGLGRDPQHIYANTDAAKETLIADLNAQMRAVEARMPEYFGRLPKTGVEVRRVPKDIEAGAPLGRYEVPSLDGSRPGVYYINLRDTAEWPRWSLPTLTYHEAMPGHHFQAALQQENADTPMLMKTLWYSAAGEGWGLYAEQLADEIGMYDDNPLGRIGFLQSLIFRAARLVVDTGLHHKRWSRDEAVRYMVETLGDTESAVTNEVDRYCVLPGQATSYKVGHTEWVRLREHAKATLGDRFDIRGFHDTALTVGASPLTVVQRVIGDWVATRAA